MYTTTKKLCRSEGALSVNKQRSLRLASHTWIWPLGRLRAFCQGAPHSWHVEGGWREPGPDRRRAAWSSSRPPCPCTHTHTTSMPRCPSGTWNSGKSRWVGCTSWPTRWAGWRCWSCWVCAIPSLSPCRRRLRVTMPGGKMYRWWWRHTADHDFQTTLRRLFLSITQLSNLVKHTAYQLQNE